MILGKTNTPEFGYLGTTENRLGGPCRNPWNTERTTGGSSGGAGGSAVAGLCALAQGSDGGGSHPHTVELLRRLRDKADAGARAPVRRAGPHFP